MTAVLTRITSLPAPEEWVNSLGSVGMVGPYTAAVWTEVGNVQKQHAWLAKGVGFGLTSGLNQCVASRGG